MQLYRVLKKKIDSRNNYFWIRLKKKFGTKLKTKKLEPQGDSLEIMNGVVRHMVYLTGKMTNRQKIG